MPMRADTAPFNDNNVRLAIKHSIDREHMAKSIFHGYAELGNDHSVHSASKYHAKGLPQRQYDPEKAKFYLKKAGHSNLKVQLHASDSAFTGAVDAAILSKEYAKKSGIEIEVVRTPDDGYWSHTWMQKPWCMSYWGGRPTPDVIFSVRFASDAPYNDCFWYHDRFDELLIQARKELNETRRIEMYAEMQEILNMEGGPVIPLFKWQVDAVTSKIKTPPLVGGQFGLDYFRYADRWWFES
jgi:peptide/nickel transport system substrate-binding protein